MDLVTQTASTAGRLPAQRIDAEGRAHVDQKAVLALALPLMAGSGVQIVLNLTDMWFIGHISTQALAAVGTVQWLILAVVLVLGGVGAAVQTLVAQAHGARRYRHASQAVWTALWATLCAVPLFIAIGMAGHLILAPFGFDPNVEKLATAFWLPRVSGAVFGSAVWALLEVFNGVARPAACTRCSLPPPRRYRQCHFQPSVFYFPPGPGRGRLGLGNDSGAGHRAGMLGFDDFSARRLSPRVSHEPDLEAACPPPVGAIAARPADGTAARRRPCSQEFSISSSMMQVRLGLVAGAATQMVMVLTSIAYMPGFGISQAGTTLVGQSIGAGDRAWALRVGTRVILLAALYMGSIGLLIALAGPWVLPFFTAAHDADAVAAVALGSRLLWLAAVYQFFDGLNLSSGLCLRGAGDAIVPAALVLPVSLLVFVPLAHALTFAPGQGWVNFLPQFGWGAYGGWLAVVLYLMLLGSALFLRWRSGVWQKIRI